jgi:serine protease Do
LVSTGKVERGFLGVKLEALTPDLAAEFGTATGALVADVNPDTPAEKAGLKSGDIITRLSGKLVENANHLQLAIISLPPGTDVKVGYLRDGKEATVTIKLGVRPPSNLEAANKDEGVLNGVAVADITDEVREQLQLPAGLKGAVITEVDPDSGSAQAGLAQGDVILELNRRPVHNSDEAVRLSDEIKGPKVLVRIWRKGFSQYVVVDETKKGTPQPSEAPPQEDENQ